MGSFNGCSVKEFSRKTLCLRYYYSFDMACFWLDMITYPLDSVLSLVHIVTDFIFSLLRFWSIDIWFSPLLSYYSFWMASCQPCEYLQFEQPGHHSSSNLFLLYQWMEGSRVFCLRNWSARIRLCFVKALVSEIWVSMNFYWY